MKSLYLPVAVMAVMVVASVFGIEVSNVGELTDALARINAGASSESVVTLAAGTYDLSDVCMRTDAENGDSALYVARPVVLEGADATSWRDTEDGDTKTVLDAGGKRRVLWLDAEAGTSTLRNFTITGGGGVAKGGAVRQAERGRSTLVNCVVRDNRVTDNGYNAGVLNVDVHASRFSNNETDNRHGGRPMGVNVNFYDSLVECATNSGDLVRGTIASNTTFRALSATEWSAKTLTFTKMIDCTVTGDCRGSWALIELNSSAHVLSGCTFVDLPQTTGNAYPAVEGKEGLVTNCVFTRVDYGPCVRGTSKLRIVDSVFTNNAWTMNWQAQKGKCVRGDAADMPVLVNCTFTDNVMTNAFGCLGAACAYVVASNCTFTGNCARDGASAVYGGTYVGCTFRDNRSVGKTQPEWFHGGSTAFGGSFFDCTFEGNEDVLWSGGNQVGFGTVACADVVSNCVFRNCRSREQGAALSQCTNVMDTVVEGCYSTTHRASVYQSPLARCTVAGAECDGVYASASTNCLFYGLSSKSGNNQYVFRQCTDVVNCTVADITDPKMATFNNAADVRTTVRNSIFSNVGGIRGVLDGDASIAFDHCFYDEIDADFADGVVLTGCIQSPRRPFVPADNPHYDVERPYAIRPWRTLLGSGVSVGFTADDVDRAGNPRLRDGQLDLGCYQCMLQTAGLSLIFR